MIHRMVAVSLCAWLALVGTAGATGLRGRTSQRLAASLVTGADGLVTRVRIAYDAPCANRRYRFPNTFRFESPFRRSTVDDVTETVRIATRLRGGGRNRQTASFTAHRTVDAAGVQTWSGTFRTRSILTRRGKRLDTCELKRVTWSVSHG
jgi:hypothetical protein